MRVPGYLLAGAPGIPVRRLVAAATCDDAMVAALGDSPGDRPGDASGPNSPGFDGGHRTPRSSRVAAAAFLRVYEPAATTGAPPLCGAEHALPVGGAEHALPVGGAEHAAALRAATALPPRVVCDLDLLSSDDDPSLAPAFPLSPPADDGVRRTCPAELTWRAMLALDEFRHTVPAEVLSAFLPHESVAEASRRLAEQATPTLARARGPHIRTRPWRVPLPWFAIFSPDGRQEQPLRFRAAMAEARRNVARALAVVRRTPTDFLPERRLEDVGRWLEEFHAKSVVELDYSGLRAIVPDVELGSANSVALMAAALQTLRARPDGADAAGLAGLTAIRDRWAAVRAFERAN